MARLMFALIGVVLPWQSKRQVDEELDDDLRRAVAVDYVTRIDDVLELVLRCASTGGDVAAVTSADWVR